MKYNFFIPLLLFIIAEALPVSEPVPAVVGIAIIGILVSTAFSNYLQYLQNPILVDFAQT